MSKQAIVSYSGNDLKRLRGYAKVAQKAFYGGFLRKKARYCIKTVPNFASVCILVSLFSHMELCGGNSLQEKAMALLGN
ncbi:MAG: hypothetical protein IJ911_01875 [Salinivirgaceae bacterium]|nr:hypothetical protein [Salinivirgaceae bacterium]